MHRQTGEHLVPPHKIRLTLGKSCQDVLCDCQAEVHFRLHLLPGCRAKVFGSVWSLSAVPALLSMPWLVSPVRMSPSALLSPELPAVLFLSGVLLELTEHMPHAVMALSVPAQGNELLSYFP